MSSSFAEGDLVRHPRFGAGTVRFDAGETVIVRFAEGIQECDKASLTRLHTLLQALTLTEWHSPLEVITRAQAEAIISTNDTWGVFSRSRIELLPHQLWVCRRVLETWPARWLVADDVGLGKTIEAGLILWPLLARGTVKRLLVLCPAALVEQWQYRLRSMFDIRLARYAPELDNARSDFWNSQSYVVASLQTLRANRGGRQDRLVESEPWDLLVVDEAHHLNADEHSGPTLGYRFVERLVTNARVTSLVFFTGTPHRGKDYGFWSLLQLLRPDLFDPKQPVTAQLPLLSQVMIRNNKQNVTNLRGERLFHAPHVESATYGYSAAEAHFYQMLTSFIVNGEAYASGLPSTDGRAVILVLIAMQKLASSSVAAIRRALNKRLEGVLKAKAVAAAAVSSGVGYQHPNIAQYDEADLTGDLDTTSQLEEGIVAEWAGLRLMRDEESRLRELIDAANAVTEETKVQSILSLLQTRFGGRSVLLFTEYKATQSLVMSALLREFGDGCVAFINGDGRAEEVIDSSNAMRTIVESRESAAERFNAGTVRFLVSTEAGGEGIDLQERCHSLIHVDLPWNPMRMHQRVGRLNRYGQSERVDVISLHNPETVESLIWEKLNEKIENIMRALGEVMDEPEDLLQLVLGMTSPSLFRELFGLAHTVPHEALSDWFDRKTSQFGGRDAVDTVKELVGYAARFDYQQVSDRIPRCDLPALRPFLRSMLVLNGRQPRESEDGLSFKTPDTWLEDPGVRPSYESLNFDRIAKTHDAVQFVVGVGHRAFDQALHQARNFTASVATVPGEVLTHPLLIYSVTDQITTESTVGRSVIAAVEFGNQITHRLLRDWELLDVLNMLTAVGNLRRLRLASSATDPAMVADVVEQGRRLIEAELARIDVPFRLPTVAPLAVLWPVRGYTERANPLVISDFQSSSERL